MAPEAQSSLFDPQTFVSGGGFLNKVDCTIEEARVVTQEGTPFDPQDEDSAFLKLTFQPDEEDSEPRIEYYRFGGVDRFTPSVDGKRVVHEPDQHLIKSTKSGIFFASLVNAGFPVSDIPKNDDVTFLEGLHVHVDTVDMPEMKGGKDKFKKKEGKKGPSQVVVIAKILEPKAAVKGAAKKTAAAPKAAGKAAAPAAAASTATAEGAEDAAVNAIVDIITEKGEAQTRLIPTDLMKRITDVAIRPAVFKLIGDKAWLGSTDRPWDADLANGKLTPNEMTAAIVAARE